MLPHRNRLQVFHVQVPDKTHTGVGQDRCKITSSYVALLYFSDRILALVYAGSDLVIFMHFPLLTPILILIFRN